MKNKLQVLLLLLFSLHSQLTFAHREDFYFLYGNLGDRTIALKVEGYEEAWFAKYYYMDEKKDIFLKGVCDSTGCVFNRSEWDQKKKKEVITETFKFHELPDHTWEGEWRNNKRKKIKFRLYRIEKDSIRHNFSNAWLNKLDPYSYLRSSDVTFETTGKKEKINGVEVEWRQEPNTGISAFRFSSGLDTASIKSGNAFMDSIHLKEFENYCTCTSISFPGEYSYSTMPTYVSYNLCSFRFSNTVNCQGNFKSEEESYMTFLIQEKKQLTLDQYLSFGQKEFAPPESGEWYQYRYKIFGKKIRDIVGEIYKNNLPSDSATCNYSNEKVWQFPEWYLSPEGVHVKAVAPGVDHSCDKGGWLILPYSRIDKLLNPKYK